MSKAPLVRRNVFFNNARQRQQNRGKKRGRVEKKTTKKKKPSATRWGREGRAARKKKMGQYLKRKLECYSKGLNHVREGGDEKDTKRCNKTMSRRKYQPVWFWGGKVAPKECRERGREFYAHAGGGGLKNLEQSYTATLPVRRGRLHPKT